MRLIGLWPQRLFNRRAVGALFWVLLVLAAAVAANIVGIYLVGSVANWEQWLAASTDYFLAWRLCLYGTIAYGWVWMRRRLLARETDRQARHRLIRAEAAGVIAVIVLETSLLMQAGA